MAGPRLILCVNTGWPSSICTGYCILSTNDGQSNARGLIDESKYDQAAPSSRALTVALCPGFAKPLA